MRRLTTLTLLTLLLLPPIPASAQGRGEVVGGRPAGCPQAFCACGASIEVFGHIVSGLNAAASWFRFRRSSPLPNTVAVRRHHVFVLKEHVAGDHWLVMDYNSGRHLTRRHVRSIAGWTIVDPRS